MIFMKSRLELPSGASKTVSGNSRSAHCWNSGEPVSSSRLRQ